MKLFNNNKFLKQGKWLKIWNLHNLIYLSSEIIRNSVGVICAPSRNSHYKAFSTFDLFVSENQGEHHTEEAPEGKMLLLEPHSTAYR